MYEPVGSRISPFYQQRSADSRYFTQQLHQFSGGPCPSLCHYRHAGGPPGGQPQSLLDVSATQSISAYQRAQATRGVNGEWSVGTAFTSGLGIALALGRGVYVLIALSERLVD